MDASTCKEIEKVVLRTLKDAGITRPPVRVPIILEHLRLYRDFYSLQDPSFLDRAKHRLKVDGRKLLRMLKSISLKAVLLYDQDRIVLDNSLPEAKHNWASCHEIAHRIFEWHRPWFYGDTAQTLQPDWQERLEAEANYGASALMFCGPVFTKDACDTLPSWQSVHDLAVRYDKSKSSTLWRYVQHGPDVPMAMLISTPHWETKPDGQPDWHRHYAVSARFGQMFAQITAEELQAQVDSHTHPKSGGPVGDYAFGLRSADGAMHEFRGQSFYNRHDVLTLFTHQKRLSGSGLIVPAHVQVSP